MTTLKDFMAQKPAVAKIVNKQIAAAKAKGVQEESERQDRILMWSGERIAPETRRALDSGISPADFMAQKGTSHKAKPNGDQFSVPAAPTAQNEAQAEKNEQAIRVWDRIYSGGYQS